MRVSIASVMMRSAVLTALLLAVAPPCFVAAQSIKAPPPKPLPAESRWPAGLERRLVAEQPKFLVERPEVEPNDSIATANVVALGDDILGTIGRTGDIDWFALDLAAGAVIELEVFASRNGSPLDSYMVLVAPDRVTTIAINDDITPVEILDSRIRAAVPAAGRYYIGLLSYECAAGLPSCTGGANYTYRLHLAAVQAAPGDPSTLVAQGIGSPWGAAAAANGDLYVADQDGRVLRVTSTGSVSTYASNIGLPFDVAFDAAGDLLVAGELTSSASGVTRIKPDGTRSVFVTGLQSARAITIGPDGDVWVANPTLKRVHRYSMDGVAKTPLDMPSLTTALMDIAFSPSGQLHVGDYSTGVFRVVNNALVRLISFTSGQPGGIAFDRDGYIYMGSASSGVRLYDPTGVLINGPFAEFNLDLPGNLVFGRDASGAMTNRLFVINYGASSGSIRLLNPAGVRAPGFRIGIDLLLFAQDTVTPAVMGAAYSYGLRLTNATGAVTWSVDSGTLPPGVTLGATTGVLTGVPSASGRFTFVVRATSGSRFGTRSVTVDVVRPALSMSDATNHLLGVTGVLSADLLRFLDLQGNKNGRFDAGDLQTYLRAEGRIK